MRWYKGIAILFLAVILGTTAAAGPDQPQFQVNGKAVLAGAGFREAYIANDRMYVAAAAFAASIGASYSEDAATGVATISTGNGIPSVAKIKELNPKLTLYKAMTPYIPAMGIHEGMAGPHITLAVSKEGTVNALELAFPAAGGWAPWFDQPEGQSMDLPGLGDVYTQHIYVTDPAGLVEKAGEPVILDGRFLSFAWEPKPARVDGKLYIPVRPAVELLGGSIQWDNATRTAAATLKPGPLTWEQLKRLNPKLAAYEALTPLVPNMGIHMGVHGPGLVVLVDSAGNVVGFEMVVPAATPWAPWFDQPEGQPFELPGLGQVWSQHLYLVDPDTIQ